MERDGLSANDTTNVTVKAPTPPVGDRAYADRPDDFSGSQFHVMYIIPSDGVDLGRDTTGVLEASIGSIQNWFKSQSGGGSLRIDTYQGQVDVTFLRLQMSDTEVAAKLDSSLAVFYAVLDTAGYLADKTRKYIVYYDGTSNIAPCGRGGGPLATFFLHGSSCIYEQAMVTSPSDPPQYWEYGFAHEALHTLGIVSPDAPHVGYVNGVASAHACDGDGHDLMDGDGCSVGWTYPLVLDYNHDDYYNPNGLPDGIVNLYDSPFWNKGG